MWSGQLILYLNYSTGTFVLFIILRPQQRLSYIQLVINNKLSLFSDYCLEFFFCVNLQTERSKSVVDFLKRNL